MAVERQQPGPGRGRLERVVVGTGCAVGDPEEIGPILVHVVDALEVVQDAGEVLDLARLPPDRLRPRCGDDDERVVSRQGRVVRPEISVRPLRPHHAAMQIHADLIRRCGIVGIGDVHDVGVLDAVAVRPGQELAPGRNVGRIRPSRAQRVEDLAERRLGGDDRVDRCRKLCVGARVPELRHCRVERLVSSYRQHGDHERCDGKCEREPCRVGAVPHWSRWTAG